MVKKIEVLLNVSIEKLQNNTNGGLTDSLITIGNSEEQFKLQLHSPMRFFLIKVIRWLKLRNEIKKITSVTLH